MSKSCVICGEGPTVKSHLLPRAVAHDIRADQKSLWLGSIHHDGYEMSQSGVYDWLLCDEHESAIGGYETYAINFCRDFTLTAGEVAAREFRRDETDNDKLIRFACSVLWRHHACDLPVAKGVNVGGWEPTLRAITFDNAPVLEPSVVLARYAPNGLPDDKWAIPPAQSKFDDRRVWSFVIYGMIFMVKLDKRPFSPSTQKALLNGRDVVFGVVKSMDRDLPGIRAISRNFTRPAKWNRPGR